MSFYLRVIKLPRWSNEPQELAWLKQGEIPSDPLADLNTSKNSLSLYYVEDESNHFILKHIAAALAATRDSFDKLDFQLIDAQTLARLELPLYQTLGDTPDQHVNSLHYDLRELSAQKLLKLAEEMLPQSARRDRISEREIQALIQAQVESGRIDIEHKSVKPKMKKSLEHFIPRK